MDPEYAEKSTVKLIAECADIAVVEAMLVRRRITVCLPRAQRRVPRGASTS